MPLTGGRDATRAPEDAAWPDTRRQQERPDPWNAVKGSARVTLAWSPRILTFWRDAACRAGAVSRALVAWGRAQSTPGKCSP